jgi:lipopolysaccharide export system protein LptA
MPAFAEQADRSKPVSITANNFDGDEIKQVAIYTGAVEVHQGTLEMLGDKLTLTVSPQGFRIFTMTGGPVRMKERRDPKTKGVEEWMHAVGTKAVYDEAADKITLTGNAKISRSENGTVKDTTVGDIIIYDMRRARSYVKGDTVGGHKTRVNTVLAPRQQTAGKGQNTKSSPAPLQGVSRINSGKRSK